MSGDGSWDDGNIRITLADANSDHVDDLLRRQANLRGETGIGRNRRGRWYYQNWFLFMLAGCFAAFLGWSIIEPYFDDMVYLRGTIEAVDFMEEPEQFATKGADGSGPEREVTIAGTITIRDQQVTIGTFTRPFHAGDVVSIDDFMVGKDIGLYADPIPSEDGKTLLWLAMFVDNKPVGPLPEHPLTMEALERRSNATGMVIFAVMAALIGLMIGAVDGIVCRMWGRAALSGLVGLGVGFLGGFIASVLANLIYAPLASIAQQHVGDGVAGFSAFGFALQVLGRTLAWGMAGIAMGLGQGIALRSSRLLVFGVVGGVAGGLLGGLLFDPIDLLFLGTDKPSAHVSRLVGFLVIGASVGGLIGVVELLARDAWLRMEEGPLAGKEFLVFKDVMKVGSSPRSDIYLFNDPRVEGHHATLRTVGEAVEIESINTQRQVLVNERAVARARLRHGDRIALGRTVFVYQRRGG